jgi:hypothetical protein
VTPCSLNPPRIFATTTQRSGQMPDVPGDCVKQEGEVYGDIGWAQSARGGYAAIDSDEGQAAFGKVARELIEHAQ